MTGSDPKTDLHRYLQDAREALLWKLDGLTEYNIRRPMVPTGTNSLGLIKHVASVELGYCGDCPAVQRAGAVVRRRRIRMRGQRLQALLHQLAVEQRRVWFWYQPARGLQQGRCLAVDE